MFVSAYRLYNLDVNVSQPRLLKLRLFFLDMQRTKPFSEGVGDLMTLMSNFIERAKNSISFIRNKLK
jgi:hypothetical protein